MRRLLLCGILCLSIPAFSQNDSIPAAADTTRHSVKKAVILSAVVPGAGQIYNHIAMPKGKKKAYWKVPLIYGGLGATGYYLFKNQSLMRDLRREYESRDNGNAPVEFTEYDKEGIGQLYVQRRTSRDLCIIGVGLVYVLNVVDAGVEAHFVNFDISEDLSLNVSPTVLGFGTPGVSLRLNFHNHLPARQKSYFCHQ
jgi:hypothetical protein